MTPPIGPVRCIVIEGADARRFAQAQFSGNVDALAPERWQWNAWLTPQGRVRVLMHLADPGDGTLLAVLRGGDAQEIRTALTRYLLRVKATLAVRDFACRADGPAATGTIVFDNEEIVLGHGSRSLRLGTLDGAPVDPGARTAWRLDDIREGWPTLPEGEPPFLPPALGLEHLQAVSFDKGCYPGQEIAARLRYRGGHKHRLYHLQRPALEPGDAAPFPESITCLDAVTHDGTTDALAVGPMDLADEIDHTGEAFRVVSRFAP
ncbi:MAG TPA: folate-binding protein [Rhodanobacteraceae bacterium]|nr:folate-binding protein [Rhodanobacteraceae bacterium]